MKAIPINMGSIRKECKDLKEKGFRFVTLTCVEIDEEYLEIIYHFDKDLQMKHYRVKTKKNETAESISDIFFASFLVANVIIDEFGVKFNGLVLDFGGTLFLGEDAERTPFCKYGINKTKDKDTQA